VLLVPEEEETVDVDVYVEDEDDVEDRLTMLRKRGYLAFYDRPPLMTVALVLSWIFVQRKRGYPPYDEDAYCLGPDTPFRTVFAHAYAHSSREHLYSNVVSMLLVGAVLEAVEGPLCVLCIFVCAVPCGAAYHSLWKPHVFVRGASGGVYGVMASHVSTMLMNWHEMPLRYFRLLACVLVLAAEVAGRYWYRQPNLGYAAHFGGAVGGAAAALVLVRNVRLRCHEFAFLFVGLVVYAASGLAVYYYAGDSRPALGMALVSPPLVMQLGMTSCSYDGDDSVLEPGARVFDLSAWRALCCGRPHAVDGDGDEVV
jgi:membrane associated rhomboid family serine protease